MTSETCLPTTAWFLVDGDGRPLGQVFRAELPEVGARVDAGVVVAFEELRPTCSMRRFRVVVKGPSAEE